MNRFDLAFCLLSVLPLLVGLSLLFVGSGIEKTGLCLVGCGLCLCGFYASYPLMAAMEMADGKARYQLVAHPDGSKAWEFVRDQPSK